MSWLYTLVFAGLLFSSNHTDSRKLAADRTSMAAQTASASQDETERFEHTYPLSRNGRLSLSNVNGSIVIKAWDRQVVQLVAVKTADTKERLADVQIKVDAKPDYIA